MRLALMIIDMQKEYYEGNSKNSMDSAVEYINAAIKMFRDKNLPIIWVQDKGDVAPGEIGFEIINQLQPQKNDYRIIKEYGNSFNKTECSKIVKDENIDTLIISGYCAEYCVLSTYRGALDLDIVPVIFRGSIASGVNENIRFVEAISDIASYQVLKKLVNES